MLYIFLLLLLIILILVYGGAPTDYLEGDLYKYKDLFYVFVGKAPAKFRFYTLKDNLYLEKFKNPNDHVFHLENLENIAEKDLEFSQHFYRYLYYKRNFGKKTIQINKMLLSRDHKVEQNMIKFKEFLKNMKKYDSEDIAVEAEKKIDKIKEFYLFLLYCFVYDPANKDMSTRLYIGKNLFYDFLSLGKYSIPPIVQMGGQLVGPTIIKTSEKIILVGEVHYELYELEERLRCKTNESEYLTSYYLNLTNQIKPGQKIRFYIEQPDKFNNFFKNVNFNTKRLFQALSSTTVFIPQLYDYRYKKSDEYVKNRFNMFKVRVGFDFLFAENFNNSKLPYAEKLLSYEPEKGLAYQIIKKTENLLLRKEIFEDIANIIFTDYRLKYKNYDVFRNEINKYSTKKTKYKIFLEKNPFISLLSFELRKLRAKNFILCEKFIDIAKKFYGKKFKNELTLQDIYAFYIDIYNASKILRKNHPYNIIFTGSFHTKNLSEIFQMMGIKFRSYGNDGMPVVDINIENFKFI